MLGKYEMTPELQLAFELHGFESVGPLIHGFFSISNWKSGDLRQYEKTCR